MATRLSHSSLSRFQTCAKSYEIRYIDRVVSVYKSSALFFGSAIDKAQEHMLKNKAHEACLEESMRILDEEWEQQKDNEGNITDLPKNTTILYSKYDYDGDLLEKPDWRELFKLDEQPFEARSRVEEALKSGTQWGDIPETDRIVYNFSSWLSVKRKGHLLLKAYHDQILPQIDTVIEVQREVVLEDSEGNKINGFVDLIAKLKDGRVAVLDNKTSSMDYEPDSVQKSAQLGLYQTILNSYVDDPTHPFKHKIDWAGYLVLNKKIEKEKTKICKSCGYKGEGSHKTCNNEIDGKRCGGEWEVTKKFSVKTQVIVDKVSPVLLNLVMDNADVIKRNIEAKLFPRSLTACDNQFGKPCEFYNLCHKNDTTGLIKLPEKK